MNGKKVRVRRIHGNINGDETFMHHLRRSRTRLHHVVLYSCLRLFFQYDATTFLVSFFSFVEGGKTLFGRDSLN